MNVNRFEKVKFYLYCDKYKYMKPILECFSKGMRVVIVDDNYKRAVEDFPDLKIIRK